MKPLNSLICLINSALFHQKFLKFYHILYFWIHILQIMNIRIPKIAKNFYFIVGAFFLVWMLFIDSNDLYTQYKLRDKMISLEAEKAYYLEKIIEIKEDREALLSNKDLLEKFAREKYLMKKSSEDLYIIVEEE